MNEELCRCEARKVEVIADRFHATWCPARGEFADAHVNPGAAYELGRVDERIALAPRAWLSARLGFLIGLVVGFGAGLALARWWT